MAQINQLSVYKNMLVPMLLSLSFACQASDRGIEPVLAGFPVERINAPAQKTWHWTAVPANADHLPWPQAFAFKQIFGWPSEDEPHRFRWLSLQTHDASWMPGFYDTVSNNLVFLSPSARIMCNGTYVDSVVSVSHVFDSGLQVIVAFMWKLRKDLPSRRIETFGRLDAQGQWTQQPVKCSADTPQAAYKPIEPIALSAPLAQPEVELVSHFGHPGLRNIRTGQWITPPPSKDPVLAQWWSLRRAFRLSEIYDVYLTGVIDTKGQMIVPFVFGSFADVQINGVSRLCLEHEYKRRCTDYRLPKPTLNARDLKPKKDGNGLWGYVDAAGQWILPAQFQKAGKFVNGYAVVQGKLPATWQPAGPRSQEPVIRSIKRHGHAWIVTAQPEQSADRYQVVGNSALIDNQGRWLLPFAD